MEPLRRLRAWGRRIGPRRADPLLGLLAAAGSLLEAALLGLGFPNLLGVTVVVLAGSAVALRRLLPLVALVLLFSGWVIVGQKSAGVTDLTGPFLCMLAVMCSVGTRVAGRRFVAALAIASVGTAAAVLTDQYAEDLSDFIFGLAIVVAAPLFVGRFLRQRSELNEALREKAERLDADREAEARAAVAEERRRIASELHDAVAHALTGMVIQASAARRLTLEDPDRARTAFAAVEDSGREALDEMRRLLGVLRREDAGLALDPQPRLEHLPALVRRTEASGLPVSLSVSGVAVPLAPGLDLAAYRVVQEALGAASGQGEARAAEVRLTYASDRLDIFVADDGAVPPSGRSMLGVRERLAAYGAEVAFVPGADDAPGQVVRARIPLGAA